MIPRIAEVQTAAVFLDPLAYIRLYESGGDYTIGVGGTDLSGAPLNQYGFPQWAGYNGSHAAGAYQFEPATWEIYASKLGITDFSQRSQDAVAAACFGARGFADWSPYDAPLAAAIKAAGGEAMFSLGVAWLAATGGTVPTPPSPPTPPPPVPPAPVADQIASVSGTVTDSSGKQTPFSWTAPAAAVAMLAMLGGGSAAVVTSAIQSPAPVAETAAHRVAGGYGVGWRFGTDSRLECAYSDGTWKVCQ